MPRKKLFDGNNNSARFARAFYSRLLSGEPFTNADVLADCGLVDKDGVEIPTAEIKKYSLSHLMSHHGLKHIPQKVISMMEEVAGKGCVEKVGRTKGRTYCYVGEKKDPLREQLDASVVYSVKRYYEFCEDSAGFFPTSWLDYFFEGTADLLDIRKHQRKGSQTICSSADHELTNIDLLPQLHDWTKQKKVLSVKYHNNYNKEETLVFHPHYLKEFNGRWFWLGHADGKEPAEGYNLAIDRILGRPTVLSGIDFVPAADGFYEEHFLHLVGVSFNQKRGICPVDIRIRVHNEYMFNLMRTKKIHHSQTVAVDFGEHEDGTYGELAVHVSPNNEFYGRLLQMGGDLEVKSPLFVRRSMAKRVNALASRYER